MSSVYTGINMSTSIMHTWTAWPFNPQLVHTNPQWHILMKQTHYPYVK